MKSRTSKFIAVWLMSSTLHLSLVVNSQARSNEDNICFETTAHFVCGFSNKEIVEKENLKIFNGSIRLKNIKSLEIVMEYTTSSILKSHIAQRRNNEIN